MEYFVVAAAASNKDTRRPQGEDVESDRVRDVPPEEQDDRPDVQDKAGGEVSDERGVESTVGNVRSSFPRRSGDRGWF